MMHHIDDAKHGFLHFLRNDLRDDLSQLCCFFLHHFPHGFGLKRMAKILRGHIVQLGNDLLVIRNSKIKSREGAMSGREAAKERELIDGEYVKDLISLEEEHLVLVSSTLRNDRHFHRGIVEAFSELLAGKTEESETHNHISLLNRFCHNLLQSKYQTSDKLWISFSDDEIERYLECVMRLLVYIPDKDLFLETYRNFFAKRLLTQKSSSSSLSYDMERSAVSSLKRQRCGGEYTGKLEGMLTDILISIDQRKDFQEYLNLSSNQTPEIASLIDFNVQVLSYGVWPSLQKYDVALPLVMSQCCQVLTISKFSSLLISHRFLMISIFLGRVGEGYNGSLVKGRLRLWRSSPPEPMT